MPLQKSEPESLMGSHCFIKKVQKSRHFCSRNNGPTLEGRNLAHLYGTPNDFLPGRANAGSHSSKWQFQGGDGVAREEKCWAIGRKGISETKRAERKLVNLKRLFRGVLGFLFQLFLAQAAEAEPARLPRGPQLRLRVQWTEPEKGNRRGKSKAGQSPTCEKRAAKKRNLGNPKTPHTCERSDQEPTHLYCSGKNCKDKWVKSTQNLTGRMGVNADKNLSGWEENTLLDPLNLWIFQYNTRNGPERRLTWKNPGWLLQRLRGGGHLRTEEFLPRTPDRLVIRPVAPVDPPKCWCPDSW